MYFVWLASVVFDHYLLHVNIHSFSVCQLAFPNGNTNTYLDATSTQRLFNVSRNNLSRDGCSLHRLFLTSFLLVRPPPPSLSPPHSLHPSPTLPTPSATPPLNTPRRGAYAKNSQVRNAACVCKDSLSDTRCFFCTVYAVFPPDTHGAV